MSTVRLGVDVGGTFTDVALVVAGALTTTKVPTTEPQSDGVIAGVKAACAAADIEPAAVDDFAHAMTVSVNALLERDGAKTALVTTAGFRDVISIGRQDRPALYDLTATVPPPLVPRRRRFEVDERTTPTGVERAVDERAVRDLAARIDATDTESVAVSLLHAYAHPANEARVAAVLREALSVPVSVSHEVRSEFREFERTATTAADAYVTPAIEGYLGQLLADARDLGLPDPRVMRSNGGVADAETVANTAVTTVLSGPAAGVVGAAAVARGETVSVAAVDGKHAGVEADAGGDADADTNDNNHVVTFDMGGTSSDVSVVHDGTVARTAAVEIGDVPIRTPAVDVETVGAGGGSIAWTDDGGALRVGPTSAGADPGPACYDRGGTDPTVTDAAVVLGYLGANTAFGGDLELNAANATDALAALAAEAGLADATAAASGVYRVATATMARAIRAVTVERGDDPREFTLVAFGGAGPMHAAALADRLGMTRVLVPGPAGVLSAYGLLAADETHDAVQTIRLPVAASTASAVEDAFTALTAEVLDAVSDPTAATVEWTADCRYEGQRFELTVPVGEATGRTTPAFDPATLETRFEAAHERTRGYQLDASVEAVTARATATVQRETPTVTREESTTGATRTRPATFPDAGTVETTVCDRHALAVGETLAGPAVLEGGESTTVVPPTWTARMRTDGTVVLESADATALTASPEASR